MANHLAYTVLLMRKDGMVRTKREMDSTWADALAKNDKDAVGKYHQQVLELKPLRLRIDRALEFIRNPLAGHGGE